MRALKIPYLTISLGYSKKESFSFKFSLYGSAVICANKLRNERNRTKFHALKCLRESFAGYQNLYRGILGKCFVKVRKIFTTRPALAGFASRFDAAVKSP